MRTADQDKFNSLLPSQQIFEKIHHLQKIPIDDIELNYSKWVENSKSLFIQMQKDEYMWDDSKYISFNSSESKMNNVSVAEVTTKIKFDETVSKYKFNAVRIEGRWYYWDGFSWLTQNEGNSMPQQ